jgi:alpha-tubulin suppressor-like RCC1 family protein
MRGGGGGGDFEQRAEERKERLSSQHLQVQRSWERPGVYAWGLNTGRVAAPDLDARVVKSPRRIPFFEGMLLRDLKLAQDSAAAIDERGDLVQWGVAYAADGDNALQPRRTLAGKNLKALALTRDRVMALAADGRVYSVPASAAEQRAGPKPLEKRGGAAWLLPSFWATSPATPAAEAISYRTLEPPGLTWGERVTMISAGLDHVLLLTSKGRVFSAAGATEAFPSRGQLGIAGLVWATRPAGAYDQCHEVMGLRGVKVAKIAAGHFHSLALDERGRVFAFGDNTMGQLGLDLEPSVGSVDTPKLLPHQQLYPRSERGNVFVVSDIAAGGSNSYITIDRSTQAGGARKDEDSARSSSSSSFLSSSRSMASAAASDVFSFGQGIFGALGNGRWTHVQGTPTKVKALSELYEYSEAEQRLRPIRVARISAGATHACAVLENMTHVHASSGRGGASAEHNTNWGADALLWGGNEHFQLGTGRRANLARPTYIPPLDRDAEREREQEMMGRGSGGGEPEQQQRLQLTPWKRVQVNGRAVSFEQRIECGHGVTAVYSGI